MVGDTPFTVAVVEDDRTVRRLITFLLKRSGYAYVEAETAAEARPILFGKPWDLAVLDRRLPDYDGAELCRAIRDEPALRNRYVIMVTAIADQQEKVEVLNLGADDYITKPFNPEELLARIQAGRRVVELQKELIVANKRLEFLSITDGLTRLFNHRYLQEQLARAFDESVRYDRPLSIAIADIDFFKKINDTYGHAVGDQVLEQVASIFRESIRSSDIAARYGGEEFAVMLPETDREDAYQFAEKIRRRIESAQFSTNEGAVPVTVSIGVSTIPQPRIKTPRQLVDSADKALYRAKRAGRNQVHSERRQQERRRESTEVKVSAAPVAVLPERKPRGAA